MDHPGAVLGGDEVPDEHPPRGAGPPALRVREVVEQPLVAQPLELGTPQLPRRGRERVGGGGVAQVLGVAAHEVAREQEGPVTGGGAVRAGGHDDVGDVRPDRERLVGWQGPRGRRPRHRGHAGQPERLRLRTGERERHGDRLVLTVGVDVVVHAELVVGQRRLVAPAVGQHAVALVRQALVVEGLERPDHRLHEGRVEGLVVVLEVDPACLPGDVLLPLLRVAQHGLAARLVERGDAHLVDLRLVGDPEDPLGLELGRQPVRVPAEAALHAPPAHRLVPRHDVLDVPGQQVPVVRQPVGERGSVVEDELVAAVAPGVAPLDGGDERAVRLPVGQDAVLQSGEVRRGGDGLGPVQRIGHGWFSSSVRVGTGSYCHARTTSPTTAAHHSRSRAADHRGTTPLAAHAVSPAVPAPLRRL